MSTAAETRVCPHCSKPFEGELLEPQTARAGYKCPHCNLFVPVERAETPEAAGAATN